MAAAYTGSASSFTAARPQAVSSLEINGTLQDIAPDGKSFAVIAAGGAGGANRNPLEVTFVLNFFDEIRRHVAPGR